MVPADSDSDPSWLHITAAQAISGGWTDVRASDGRMLSVKLPAGLRTGETVRISGRLFRVAIGRFRGAGVTGDDVMITCAVSPAYGGRRTLETPNGPVTIWFSSADGARGFARIAGQGLPARGRRAAGDLIVRLTPTLKAPGEGEVQAKRRRFAAAWSA
jgi:curved DNA-binding protein